MTAAVATNGYDQQRTNQVIEEIENLKAERRRIQQEAAKKIAKPVGDIDQQIGAKFKEAKKAWGIPTHILKAQLKIRDCDRKKIEIAEALDEDDQSELIRLRSDLGELADLPLGAVLLASKGDAAASATIAAAETKRSEKKSRRNAALDAVAGSDAPTSNGSETITTGIKPLH